MRECKKRQNRQRCLFWSLLTNDAFWAFEWEAEIYHILSLISVLWHEFNYLFGLLFFSLFTVFIMLISGKIWIGLFLGGKITGEIFYAYKNLIQKEDLCWKKDIHKWENLSEAKFQEKYPASGFTLDWLCAQCTGLHSSSVLIAHSSDVIRVSRMIANYFQKNYYFTLYPILVRLIWQEIHSFSKFKLSLIFMYLFWERNPDIKTL